MRCLLLAFALALIALTGCSLGSDPAEAEDPAASASGPSREVLRMSLWELEPPSFDPAVASDLLSDLFDPLVRMTPNLDARPSMAASWEATPDGKEWTFHLREDGRWSNGDALTAHDYEYAWKRILSPEADTGWAFYFPVRGGLAYYNCKPREESDCDRLRERVAIRASDDHTLSVGLKHRFPRLAHLLTYPAFLPVHQPTVERFGSKWWTPEHIVTSGPFRIASWSVAGSSSSSGGPSGGARRRSMSKEWRFESTGTTPPRSKLSKQASSTSSSRRHPRTSNAYTSCLSGGSTRDRSRHTSASTLRTFRT